ncbi:MAG: hypothetical protein WDN25_10295 [Acetobacteraceae bacterium]
MPVLLLAVPGLLFLLDAAATPRTAARRGWWFGLGHHVAGAVTGSPRRSCSRRRASGGWCRWRCRPSRRCWRCSSPRPASSRDSHRQAGRACWRSPAPGLLADLARQFTLTGFPWNPWGSVWELPGPVGDVFIQPAAWVGVHGLTLATLLLAATPALAGAGASAAPWRSPPGPATAWSASARTCRPPRRSRSR